MVLYLAVYSNTKTKSIYRGGVHFECSKDDIEFRANVLLLLANALRERLSAAKTETLSEK